MKCMLMNKEELRKKYKLIRDAIEDREVLENCIANKVLSSLEYINAEIICIYVNFGSEVNTIGIIRDALEKEKIVGVPVIDDGTMNFYKISSLDDLGLVNDFGIMEPLKKKENLISSFSIDLIIVPGLAFDLSNNRLGFGKGYYDKYFAKDGLKAFKMAVCFKEQIVKDKILDVDMHDVKMDIVIHD